MIKKNSKEKNADTYLYAVATGPTPKTAAKIISLSTPYKIILKISFTFTKDVVQSSVSFH